MYFLFQSSVRRGNGRDSKTQDISVLLQRSVQTLTLQSMESFEELLSLGDSKLKLCKTALVFILAERGHIFLRFDGKIMSVG